MTSEQKVKARYPQAFAKRSEVDRKWRVWLRKGTLDCPMDAEAVSSRRSWAWSWTWRVIEEMDKRAGSRPQGVEP